MAITRHTIIRALLLGASSITLTLAAAQPAAAQLTTSTIRGQVTTSAAPAAGALVEAENVETGRISRATVGANGSYTLTGLTPGTYDIGFTATGAAKITRRVTVSVGQSASLDVDTVTDPAEAAEGAEATTEGATVVVVGNRLVETKTSEVATNVSREQIENLPQNNRNFINFAALAPGISINQTETRQTFAGGGVGTERDGESTGGPQVNVFIDGVSLKSNLQQGGIVGQDISRGNPFSQSAVQEFRVLTSNFKAEYEDAGTAIITAVTKSGGNKFHGEVFGTFQNDKMISRDFQQRKNNTDVNLKRYQLGAALGGPIIQDKLFFFANYEGNIQNRASTVTPGTLPTGATLPFNPQDFAGTFKSPFREHLGFGKLTWQVSDRQLVEVTGSIRKEKDTRGFGGNQAFSRATNVRNDVYTGKLRHQLEGDGFLNEFSVDYLKTKLAFGADFSEGFGLNYGGVISTGAQADFQNPEQEGLTFRNATSFSDIQWNGSHLIKVGGKLSFQNFSVGGSGPARNPQFNFQYRPADNLTFQAPELVTFGSGDPEFKANTTQIGLFVQDDWEVNEHLLVNLGLRWDVDTNARNKDFVTSDRAVQALRALEADPRNQGSFYDVDDYISTGKNRKTDYNNFAPRVGFSYDINADQKTVLFAGYGRYYDRALYRNSAEESLFSQYTRSEVFFSTDGATRPDGRPTIIFEDRFLTPEGFADLQNSLAVTSFPFGELRFVPNDLQTPYTDQFSVGVRQRIGPLRTSLTYSYMIGKDQIAYVPLNRTPKPNAAGFFDYIRPINGIGELIAAFNEKETRYKAIYVQIDKPYNKSSGYGFGVAYTMAFSKGIGYEFNFDSTNFDYLDFQPNAGNERHRLVVNGIADLPFGLKASGLMTLGSGVPALVTDGETNGFGSNIRKGNFGPKETFFQLDLRLLKGFQLANGELQVWAEVFNVFNTTNRGQNQICCGPSAYGQNYQLFGPPRSMQLGTKFRF